ncbi:hypothetical protein BES08_30300 (plasmid) [Novosphingobium resinovorum]|uniref:Methyltransferase domain-containing protein n=2 Tax=Novosphingobium resinovorum TaxID=158500 RepID=A0A1D8AGE5_9SPHN|nr:hypothetical protein BES08_30300 [Novosphingobium resinovorum]
MYPLLRKTVYLSGSEYADRKTAFATIFAENRWQSGESVSGSGSEVSATNMLTTALPNLLRDLKVGTLLDAPCGDLNWMRHLKLPDGMHYIGADIVPDLISKLQSEHGTDARQFQVIDFVDDVLPKADVWLCRHVLFHLSFADITKALHNFAKSDIQYLIVDNVDGLKNVADIQSGGFRLANLRAAPFNLPKPMTRIANSNPPNPPEYLNVWTRDQVAKALEREAPDRVD